MSCKSCYKDKKKFGLCEHQNIKNKCTLCCEGCQENLKKAYQVTNIVIRLVLHLIAIMVMKEINAI